MPAQPRRFRDRLPRVVAEGEEGMISLVSLFAVMGLLILFGAFANVGRVASRKLEAQNAADAVAHGAAVEMARSLNAVSAANHLMGELTALCILHHGLGGDELDDGRRPDPAPDDLQRLVVASYNMARIASSLGSFYGPWREPSRDAYEDVRKQPEVGGAIRPSRLRLKQVLVWANTAYAIGGFIAALLEKIPVVGQALSAGTQFAIVAPAWWFQVKCYQEWETLDRIQWLAQRTVWFKKMLMTMFIPGLHTYTRLVVANTHSLMETAAAELGARHGAETDIYQGIRRIGGPLNPGIVELYARMPVVLEPRDPKDWSKTQLVRAATPWVQHWRVKWLQFGEQALLLSRFKCFYWDLTDQYTETITTRLRAGRFFAVRPYILQGWEPGGIEKGNEVWTRADGSRKADTLFATLGFAHRGPTRVTSFGIFRQPNPDGILAYSQGMVYGGNRQTGGSPPGFQPRVGWDTLQWDNDVRDWPGQRPVDLETYPVPYVPEPRVKVNWQAKLVPTTRLHEAVLYAELGGFQGGTRTILTRTKFFAWWEGYMTLPGTH